MEAPAVLKPGAAGYKFQDYGQHPLLYRGLGPRRAEIAFFLDASPLDVAHETIHALDEQRGLPGRVYAPPIRVETLQSLIGESPNIIPSAQPYFKIEDWTVYPRLLAVIAQSGAFL